MTRDLPAITAEIVEELRSNIERYGNMWGASDDAEHFLRASLLKVAEETKEAVMPKAPFMNGRKNAGTVELPQTAKP